ncbi:MAG TPA: kelch repeat-containing protein [Planctomycetota bacterium]|nr:kelch repeat-containing protein [Planctomycetota bacterium]
MLRGLAASALAAAALLSGTAVEGPTTATAADRPPPPIRVKGTWPRAGDDLVLTDPVVVRFSAPVDFATVDTASLRVYRPGAETVPGTYAPGTRRDGSPDPRLVVFTPDQPLAADRTFRVLVGMGLRGQGGRPLFEPILAEFETSPAKTEAGITPLGLKDKPKRLPPRGPAPKVTYTFPAGGLGNVYTDDVIIRFNRPIDPDSLDLASFRVLQGDTQVPGSVVHAEDGVFHEAIYRPDQPLYPDTTFQMIVTRDIRSDRGRFLREEFRAGFGTSPFKGGIRPLRPEDFTPGPLLEEGRAFHTADALDGGDVIVAGGQSLPGEPLRSTELFLRDQEKFERVGDLATARRKHASATLKDLRVMVCGGFGPDGQTLNSVEIYDPAGRVWTAGTPMQVSRANHTATLLSNGRVLVAAGFTTDNGSLSWTLTAEIYDPATRTWSFTGTAPNTPRGGHTATVMQNGRVLIAGGGAAGDPSAEIYNPVTGAFSYPNSGPLEYRIFHAAALTKNGTVLLAGGGPPQAEQYDPNSDAFVPSGSCPPFGLSATDSPSFATLTTISGGRVAMIGGFVPGASLVLDQVQLWTAGGLNGTGAFYPMLFDLVVPRAGHTITKLGDGRFILVGGFGTTGVTNEKRSTILLPSQ